MREIVVLVVVLLSFSGGNPESSVRDPHSCTIFTVSMGEEVFFASNEDYTNPNTRYWSVASGEGTYGGVYFGFDDLWPQGGVNEVGLAFDINALPETPLNPHPELPPLDDYEGYLVLSTCATVEEAIELVKGYNWGEAMWGQIHLADATGDAVVVSAGEGGELAFSRKGRGDVFLVSTNFNLASHGRDERRGLCSRYDRAVQMLEGIGSEEDLGIEYCAEILDAVHAEGRSVNTLYSNIYDLKNGDIYVYYSHQFEEVVKLGVGQLVDSGADPAPIADLFSDETVERAAEEYESYLKSPMVTYSAIIAAGILVLLCLVMVRRRRRASD